jgi:hypothetical protein
MKRWMHGCLIGCLVLGMGVSGVACGAKSDSTSKDDKSKDKDDKKDDSDKKDKKSDKKEDKDAKADAKDKKSDKKDSDKVDIKDLLKDDSSGEKAGMLKIQLPKDDDDKVPVIGGDDSAANAPSDNKADNESGPPQRASNVEWFPVGVVAVPNPGWKKTDKGNVEILAAADDKMALVFIPFATEDEAQDKTKKFFDGAQATDITWSQKPREVKIGPDHLPAYLGTGHALIGAAKTKMKLLFAEVNTNQPQNLLILGLADEDCPSAELDMGENIVTSIKRAN